MVVSSILMLENIDWAYWAPLAAIMAAGGFMRGFAGFGSTMLTVPLLSLLMPPSDAVLIALSTDVLVMVLIFPKAAKEAEWKPVIPIVMGAFIATPLGAWILVIASPEKMRIMIAFLVIGSACLLLSRWKYQGRQSSLASFLIGIFSGITNTAAAIGGPPIAVYFIARGMSPIILRASLNVVSFIMESVSAVAIYVSGNYGANNLVTIAALFPLIVVFVWLGSVMFRYVDNSLFNKLILYFLMLFAGYVLISNLYPE